MGVDDGDVLPVRLFLHPCQHLVARRDEVVEILLQRIGDLDGPHRFTLSGARTPSTRSTSSSVM